MRFPTSSEAGSVVSNVGRMVQWMGDVGALLDTAAAALFGSLTIQNRTQGLSSFDVQSETGFGDGLRSRFRVENNAASELVDINLRGAAVNVGDPDPSASAQGTGLNLCGPLGDTSNPIRVFKPGDSPSGTNTFRVGRNGNVVVACGGLATNAFAIKTAADAQSKYVITETGVVSWGPGGSTAPDTTLDRRAAAILGTTGAVEFDEHADFAASGVDKARLYARDNGSGKTQLVVRFPTGAIQVLATEP